MQFDVYANPSPRSKVAYPYVVDVQSNLLNSLNTRLVIPLATTALASSSIPKRLCPVFVIAGQSLMLIPFESSAISKSLVKKKVATLKANSHEILSALDAVFSGV